MRNWTLWHVVLAGRTAAGEQIRAWTEQEGLNLRPAEPPAPDQTPKTIDTLYIEGNGTGVIEAGCKGVIGQRLKQSGMEWTVRSAKAIIALRCVLQSGRFEDHGENRAG